MKDFYTTAVAVYRRTFRPVSSPWDRQQYFWDKHPQLKHTRSNGRALYEMSVFDWAAPTHTGICYSIALMAMCYAQDVLRKEARVVAIFEDIPEHPIFRTESTSLFHHAVLLLDGKYYDVFHPEGVTDINEIHYGGRYPKRLQMDYRNPRAPLWNGKGSLTDTFFDALRKRVYPDGVQDVTEFMKHFMGEKPEQPE